MTWNALSEMAVNAIMSGGGAWVLVAIGKKIPWVPLTAGQATKLRAVAAVLSAAGTLAQGLADGSLKVLDAQTLLAAAVACLAAYFTSQGVHVTVKRVTKA